MAITTHTSYREEALDRTLRCEQCGEQFTFVYRIVCVAESSSHTDWSSIFGNSGAEEVANATSTASRNLTAIRNRLYQRCLHCGSYGNTDTANIEAVCELYVQDPIIKTVKPIAHILFIVLGTLLFVASFFLLDLLGSGGRTGQRLAFMTLCGVLFIYLGFKMRTIPEAKVRNKVLSLNSQTTKEAWLTAWNNRGQKLHRRLPVLGKCRFGRDPAEILKHQKIWNKLKKALHELDPIPISAAEKLLIKRHLYDETSRRQEVGLEVGLEVARRLIVTGDDERASVTAWHAECKAAGIRQSTRCFVLNKLVAQGDVILEKHGPDYTIRF